MVFSANSCVLLSYSKNEKERVKLVSQTVYQAYQEKKLKTLPPELELDEVLMSAHENSDYTNQDQQVCVYS